MLSKQDNELLTNVEGNAPISRILKQYWLPALRSEGLVADGDPVRVRLFGQNHVAFRATDGQVGIFDEGCPHRACSLLIARNEDCALTCIFHGWKIDVSGKVVDVPTEPNRYEFGKKIKVNSYPVHETGGIIWLYFGEGEPPSFPKFEWTNLPEGQTFSRKAYIKANWLQALEGFIDSSHLGILHQSWISNAPGKGGGVNIKADLAPRYELDKVEYGIRAAAIRNHADGKYVRITEYVFPFCGMIPPAAPEDSTRLVQMAIPVDNNETAVWALLYRTDNRPFTPEEIRAQDEFFGVEADADPNDYYNPQGTFENRWHQDRKKLHDHFTGIKNFFTEDFIVQESMGSIVDRSQEQLGTSDTLIIQVRRSMLKAIKSMEEKGHRSELNQEIDYQNIRAISLILSSNDKWQDQFHHKEKNKAI